MKRVMVLGIVVIWCASLTGCPENSTSQSNRNNPQPKGKEGGEHVLKVKTNHDNYTVKQGDQTEVKVSITREPPTWDEEVRITFDKLPKGVTVTPAEGKIGKAGTDATFTLAAAPDAGDVNNAAALIEAKSGDKTATDAIKVTVKKK
jgi:hypothetical protein